MPQTDCKHLTNAYPQCSQTDTKNSKHKKHENHDDVPQTLHSTAIAMRHTDPMPTAGLQTHRQARNTATYHPRGQKYLRLLYQWKSVPAKENYHFGADYKS